MPDILIRASRKTIKHKLVDVVGVLENCYWTIHPQKDVIGHKVMFTDGVNVHAEGRIIDTNPLEGIIFTGLKKVNYPQPKKAPTRGFTYVEELTKEVRT